MNTKFVVSEIIVRAAIIAVIEAAARAVRSVLFIQFLCLVLREGWKARSICNRSIAKQLLASNSITVPSCNLCWRVTGFFSELYTITCDNL